MGSSLVPSNRPGRGITLADKRLDETLALGVVEHFPHQHSCQTEVVVICA
jgi:hypothetical protein